MITVKKARKLIFWGIVLTSLLVNAGQVFVAPTNQSPLIINEFLASNWTGLKDEDGTPIDWIEIYNQGNQPLNLAGWSLTDDPAQPEKWVFPDISIAGQSYLVVFASGKDRRPTEPNAALHTNFKISREGGYLALYSPTSRRFIDAITINYPEQFRNRSYGRYADVSYGYFAAATPGQPNEAEPLWKGLTPPVEFSVARGFYTMPFTLTLNVPTSEATIRYTTDGNEPTAENGQTYTEPIVISRTTFVRAMALKPDYKPAPTTTHSYIFLDDIMAQWWMTEWVEANPNQEQAVREALLSLPSLLIVSQFENYDFYYRIEEDLERPVSVELIDPTGAQTEFQENAGITLHGHTALEKAKKSFRLFFRDIYGATRLKTPLFPDSSVDRFNTLILRGGGNRNLTGGQRWRKTTTYGRDEWLRDSEIAMTGVGSHGIFVHLYLNGQYWGLYNLVERPDIPFIASYLGGEETEWYGRNHWGSLEGDKRRYDELEGLIHQANFADPEVYEQVQTYIDPAAFADHLILNWYVGNEDWPHNNWYIAYRNPTGRIKHFSWDGEVIWLDGAELAWKKPDYLKRNYVKPLFDALMQNPDFRITLADRMYRHLFNDGLLTTPKSQARWLEIHEAMAPAILGEIARWGDEKEGADPYTLSDWYNARDDVLAQMEGNSEKFIELARKAGYYPSIDPPQLNQHGGRVPAGFELRMSTPTGTIYYTTNGSDPRSPVSGAVASGAITFRAPLIITAATTIKARVYNGETWSALSEATFHLEQPHQQLVITEIMYHPLEREDYEFIELKNVGYTPANLSNMSFEGINFTFPGGTILQPGQFMVLVRNAKAFAERYPNVQIGGVYSGKLSNRGERLALQDVSGKSMVIIDYDDENGWPLSPDGRGDSLVMIAPSANPNNPANWRASADINGSPGTDN